MKKQAVTKATKNAAQGRKLFYYLIPFIILCFLFSYFPLHGWIYSFYDYKPPLKLSQCDFVGLKCVVISVYRNVVNGHILC